MAHALRHPQDDFSPSDAALRPSLAVVPPLHDEPRHATTAPDMVSLQLAEKAYRALQIGFVALPIVAGVDKFANELTNWSQYLAPSVVDIFNLSASSFIYGLGAFEIFLGIGIALKPRYFADALSAYLVAIIVNLVVSGQHLDTALFTIALAAGACGLARLSSAREQRNFDGIEEELEMPIRYRLASRSSFPFQQN